MSVVVVGGHDRMHCQYKDICMRYGCSAKVYTQQQGDLEGQIGRPDLMILFTNPVSHGMAKIVRKKAAQCGIPLVQSHSGSGSALKKILEAALAVK